MLAGFQASVQGDLGVEKWQDGVTCVDGECVVEPTLRHVRGQIRPTAHCCCRGSSETERLLFNSMLQEQEQKDGLK